MVATVPVAALAATLLAVDAGKMQFISQKTWVERFAVSFFFLTFAQ